MTAAVVRHGARERLARLRAHRHPANDMLDSVLEIHTPSDVRAALDQLRASYDIVNMQAKGRPDWDTHYAEFVKFYEDTRPNTFGVTGWLKISAGTYNAIRQRSRRLEEWKQMLASAGVKVAEPPKKEPPPEPLGEVLKWGAYVGLALLAIKAVSR